MDQPKRTILLIPSLAPGNGTGHLRRCLDTAQVMSERQDLKAEVLIPSGEPSVSAVDAILAAYPEVPIRRELDAARAGITVVDRRATPRAFVDELRRSSMVVGIDEGGPSRGYCDYLVDTYLFPLGHTEPNRLIPAAKAPKKRRQETSSSFREIMITFGGEDPAGLTIPACETLIEGGLTAQRITVVRGPSARFGEPPEGIRLLEAVDNLRELLHEYDLVITSFGITAFEAIAAGVPVLLVNPTAFHAKLSRDIGFPCAGAGSVARKALLRSVKNPDQVLQETEKLRAELRSRGWTPEADGPVVLSELLGSISAEGLGGCPVCQSTSSPIVARFRDRSYYRCPCTGLIYQRGFEHPGRTYDEAYFFDEYKAQYGKTYLEDFGQIRNMAVPRLRAISGLRKEGTLLDIGCAFGPFLYEARRAGYRCFGSDVAGEAVDYVSTTVGVPALRAEFPDIDVQNGFGIEVFDVLTMWYVIEHFVDLDRVLRKVSELVLPGGVFAFSTPNYRGISARRNSRRFLEASPTDHFTIWSPRIARRVLRRYGFSVRAVRITGHHPERFRGMAGRTMGLRYRLLLLVSRMFCLGDTFEVYAVKSRRR